MTRTQAGAAARVAELWLHGLADTPMAPQHIKDLADRAGLPARHPDRRALLAMADHGHKPASRTRAVAVDTGEGRQDRLQALAGHAVRMRSAGTLVPCGLRTARYAGLLGATEAGSRLAPPRGSRVRHRSHVALDESALHQSYGNPAVVADQFGSLTAMAHAGQLSVTIVPTRNPRHAVCVTHLAFADGGQPLIAVEHPERVAYLLPESGPGLRAKALLRRWLGHGQGPADAMRQLMVARSLRGSLRQRPTTGPGP
ncbi:hypothetical protein KNE206_67670 [Kitasatospora sp. NE20-6]|uniref:Scr1 family TA system antitoxin-like transcriptional regulator n=1 Tax=Kitasatospora sp. NE20-6 TaxID=2859066 RepID=UPI0034DC9113